MNKLRWSIFRNAAANVIRGGATAIVAMILPHFMAVNLDRSRFGAWTIMLQIAAYASFLDFGLQASVARFVAQALKLEDAPRARKVLGTAMFLLSLAGLIAILAAAAVLAFSASIFPSIPAEILSEFRYGAFAMALAAALQLPFSAYSGLLIGMERNDIPAFAVGGSRVFGAVLAVIASGHTHSLLTLALCIGVPSLAGGFLQMFFGERMLPRAHKKRLPVDRAFATELIHYCAGLTVWSFSMLLITGLDVTLVGHFDFAATVPYGLAASVTSIQANANSLIMSAFLAPFAAMHAEGKFEQVRSLVVRATRINTFFNVVLLASTFALGMPVLRLWVRDPYATQAYPYLIALLISQTIRLCWSSYSIALIATNHQNKAIIPAIVEGGVNLAVSLWGVKHYGAIGVAVGSIIGSLAAIPFLFALTVKDRPDLPLSRRNLLLDGVSRGFVSSLPLLACTYWTNHAHCSLEASVALWLGALLLTLPIAKSQLSGTSALKTSA